MDKRVQAIGAAVLGSAMAFGTLAQAQMGQNAAEVTGEVLRHKEVTVRGEDRNNLVVLVKPAEGPARVVDLGPADRIGDRELQNQQLNAQGRIVRIGDRAVLLADRFELAGERIDVQRPEHAAQAQRTLTGTVIAQKEVARPEGGTNLVARVETDGQPVIVDLGPADQARQMVTEGGNIEVVGKPGLVSDRLVLFADQVSADGQVAQIDRPDAALAGMAEADFSELDTSGDRQLSREEAQAFDPLARNFEQADQNENDAISESEFSAFIEQRPEQQQQRQRQQQETGTGNDNN